MSNHPRRSKVKDWPRYLKEYRQLYDMTQAKLADKLMVSKRLVENWEEGINQPPAYLKLALKHLK